MSDTRLAAFSNTGRFYAYVCDDGKLRIWEVISGILKQEFTPDLHLRSPYTRLCWINSSKKDHSSINSRKRKSSDASVDLENEFLLLGSKTGDIFLYSVSSFSIIRSFKNGHTNRINGLTWNQNTPNNFFSCSDDQHIIQWDIENNSIKRKWKCGKVSCIVISDDGTSLLSAKLEIKWWSLGENVDQVEVKKIFTGHKNDVISLTYCKISDEPCFLSASMEAYYTIRLWFLRDSDDRSAFATFSMNDAPMSISVSTVYPNGLSILASSKTGVLRKFECTKNGKKHVKPVKSKLTIQIAAENVDEHAQAEQIPIVGAIFCGENEAYIAYGNDIILSFEKLNIDCAEETMFIVRQDPRRKNQMSKELRTNKTFPTTSNKKVQYTSDSVNGFLDSVSKKAHKKTLNDKPIDVPLEKRLENLVVDVPCSASAPTADSLVHLLLQGLKSKDQRILHEVLSNSEDSVVKSTLNRLPVEAVLPLSKELVSLVQSRRSAQNEFAVKWLRHVTIIHAAHLVSNPDVTEIFAPIYSIVENYVHVLSSMHRLSGRLDLMIQQIKRRTDQSEQSLLNVNLQPKLIYQDEDSEEETENDGFKDEEASPIVSEDGDDHWDEISELDDLNLQHSPDIDMDLIDSQLSH